jgi:hypothetical protein
MNSNRETPSNRLHKPSNRTIRLGGQKMHVRDILIKDGSMTIFSANALPHGAVELEDVLSKTSYALDYWHGTGARGGDALSNHATTYKILSTRQTPQASPNKESE